MPVENDNDPRMPYQLPFPKEALDEIVIPDVLYLKMTVSGCRKPKMFGSDHCV